MKNIILGLVFVMALSFGLIGQNLNSMASSETEINWKNIADLKQGGIDWNKIAVLNQAGVNWNEVDCLNQKGINWTNLDQIKLNFKIVALDALTKGPITSQTKSILVGLVTTNNSANPFSYLSVYSRDQKLFSVSNDPIRSAGADQYMTGSFNIPVNVEGAKGSYGSSFTQLAANFPLTRTSTKSPITITVSLSIQAQPLYGAEVNFNASPLEIVYIPSNESLLPLISNQVSTVQSTTDKILNKLKQR